MASPLNIFKRNKNIWKEFEGLPNNEETLKRKAKTIAPVISKLSTDLAKKLKNDVFVEINLNNLLLDSLAIHLHIFDRLASQYIGEQERSIFLDNLCLSILDFFNNCNECYEEDEEIIQTEKLIINVFNDRNIKYTNCLLPGETKPGGVYNFTKSIGWKLSEIISQTNNYTESNNPNYQAGIEADIVISYHYVNILKILYNIRDFFVG